MFDPIQDTLIFSPATNHGFTDPGVFSGDLSVVVDGLLLSNNFKFEARLYIDNKLLA